MSSGHPDATPRLIADVGGTNARFALVFPDRPEPRDIRRLPTADFRDFASAAQAYLEAVAPPAHPTHGLCAIATPVLGDWLAMTNSPWAFSVSDNRDRLGLERLTFINDFAAQALAVPHLQPEECTRIGAGTPEADRPIGVLGPGTGLGVSVLVPCATGWHALETEGGHTTFAPNSDREGQVAARIRARYGHCSIERVASGIGLTAVYAALCELEGEECLDHLPASAITRAAAEGQPLAHEAVVLFCDALATMAGNVALATGARGGVYLCGGILPKLGALFDGERFRERFEAKGRACEYLRRIPIWQVHAADPALAGLAHAVQEVP